MALHDKGEVVVAVDVMGGDFAPHVVLKGALSAAKSGVPVTLFGPLQSVKHDLNMLDTQWSTLPILVVDAPDIVEMAEEPVSAIKKKKNSSLVQAVASVKAGQSAAVVSAGNSGALMASATFILGRLDGTERPAIAGWLPAKGRNVLALDLGANADCKPAYLCQFAHLGDEHVRRVLGIQSPRIALLSNGAEKGKGSTLVKEAFHLLENSSLRFIGNIEPQDIMRNKADVVVCDGFAGNVLLKSIEATSALMHGVLYEALKRVGNGHGEDLTYITWRDELVRQLNIKADYGGEGGALLLGVEGTVVVAHGSAREKDIERAILFAHKTACSQGEKA